MKKVNKTSIVVLMTIWSILTIISLIDPLTLGLFFVNVGKYCDYSNSVLVAINTGVFGTCTAFIYLKKHP